MKTPQQHLDIPGSLFQGNFIIPKLQRERSIVLGAFVQQLFQAAHQVS
jgi:hypothetical protein